MASDLSITRVFDASMEKVYSSWIDPEKVKNWWGPKGVTIPVCEIETKPGGKIYIVMLAGKELGDLAGQKWPMKGEFKEIKEPEEIVFTGQAIMNDKVIMENLNTVTFEEAGGKTKMVFQSKVLSSTPEAEMPLKGMEDGWSQSFDKLEKFLSKGGD